MKILLLFWTPNTVTILLVKYNLNIIRIIKSTLSLLNMSSTVTSVIKSGVTSWTIIGLFASVSSNVPFQVFLEPWDFGTKRTSKLGIINLYGFHLQDKYEETISVFSSNHALFISRSTRIQNSMSLFTFSHNLLKFDLWNFFALFLHVSHTATFSVETRVTSGTTKWFFSSVNPDMSDHITPGFHRFWTHWTNVLVINLQRNNLHLQWIKRRKN